MDSLSATLGALADATRRGILDRLARGPATVGELAGPFRVTQQAVSKHVGVLERARLVTKRRRGRTHVCALRAEPLTDVAALLDRYRRQWEESFDRLDAYLREVQGSAPAAPATPPRPPASSRPLSSRRRVPPSEKHRGRHS